MPHRERGLVPQHPNDQIAPQDEGPEEPFSRTPSSRPTRPPSPFVVDVTQAPLTGENVPRPLTSHPGDNPLDVREAFLFLHADGASTLHAIAEMTQVPLDEVKLGFLRLHAKGLVELDLGAAPRSGFAMSHERPTVTPPPFPRVADG